MSRTIDLLFFGAHPDDVELGCGGTVIKMIKKGYSVGIVDLSRGELGTRGTAETRARESAEASRILGVAVRDNCDIPDGNIEYTRENKSKVIEKIRQYQPKTVVIPYPEDRHPDHEAATRLIKDCVYYAGTEKWIPEPQTGDYIKHRPENIFYYMLASRFMPTFIVDITDEFEQRMDAYYAFKSQFFVPGHESEEPDTWISRPEFTEQLIARFKYFGHQIGVAYGEPFWSDRPLNFDGLVGSGK